MLFFVAEIVEAVSATIRLTTATSSSPGGPLEPGSRLFLPQGGGTGEVSIEGIGHLRNAVTVASRGNKRSE
jgi:2-keto-4-pentenoate hydratase/2-oxohepta-3-ene-1,7-dioic acid hydratase in catechol pathway